MDQTKISVAEIEELRQRAEAERSLRAKVRGAIAVVQGNISLSADCQMEILHRGKEAEIKELLEAYAGINCSPQRSDSCPKMAPEAQIYIYENWKSSPYKSLREFMLEKVPYTDELAQRLIDKNEYTANQRLSPKMEKHFLTYKLNHQDCEKRVNGFSFLRWFFAEVMQYFNKYPLSPEAELYLVMNYLKPKPISKEYVTVCNEVFKEYIKDGRVLNPQVERALIATGNHEAIMMYIKAVKGGLREEQVLLARGNRDEITAYFERYATLG